MNGRIKTERTDPAMLNEPCQWLVGSLRLQRCLQPWDHEIHDPLTRGEAHAFDPAPPDGEP